MSSEAVTYNDLYRILKEIIPMTHKSSKVGEIIVYAGATAPFGWKICDGSAISRTEFADLFSVIGTTYGEGDGSTTFNIPDLRGSFPIGADTTYTLGDTGGESEHTLIQDELPKVEGEARMGWSDSSAAGIMVVGTSGALSSKASGSTYFTRGSTTGSYNNVLTMSFGNNQAHNNMPPYLSVNYIICCKSSDSNLENVAIDLLYPVGCYFETSDTTFNPNISWGGTWVLETEGQVHVSSGENYEVGDTGGATTHQHTTGNFTLQINHMPSHTHNVGYYRWDAKSSGSGNWGSVLGWDCTARNGGAQHIMPNGGGEAHNHGNTGDGSNMQPYIVVNRWHRIA